MAMFNNSTSFALELPKNGTDTHGSVIKIYVQCFRGLNGQICAPTTLYPGKINLVALDTRLRGIQSLSECVV
jgi:hypothetical protein